MDPSPFLEAPTSLSAVGRCLQFYSVCFFLAKRESEFSTKCHFSCRGDLRTCRSSASRYMIGGPSKNEKACLFFGLCQLGAGVPLFFLGGGGKGTILTHTKYKSTPPNTYTPEAWVRSPQSILRLAACKVRQISPMCRPDRVERARGWPLCCVVSDVCCECCTQKYLRSFFFSQ